MILPTKHIPVQNALLSVGEVILSALTRPTTLSSLWELVRSYPEVGTWSRFILTLDMLYVMGVVDYSNDGLLIRISRI